MYNHLVKQYDAPPLPGNPRGTEAWAFLQAALRLRKAMESGDRSEILAATRLNWRLWTIIQADLLEPECQVPTDIRSNMLSLAAFVDKHSIHILAQPVAEELDVLININRGVSAGLSAAPEPTQNAPQAPLPTGVTA